ncbi:protein transport protein Sec16A isoform X2 [Ambystoma mexicanum]|uniref:protein transport protein Sec16A isoform X2 n=1 Tax=Ambystoma mexicanum TaxID=8296 RepID=UPI0037E9B6F8
MQPPPQAAVPGTGGPPPPMGMGPNAYRRNNPYSKRATVQVSGASASAIQPVTDPFAFGRLTPQNTPLNNPSKGNTLVRQGASLPTFSQPAATHPVCAGNSSHELYKSTSGTAASLHGIHPASSSTGSHAVYTSSAGYGEGSQKVHTTSSSEYAEYMFSSVAGKGLPGGYISSSGSRPGSHLGYASPSGSGPSAHVGKTSTGPGMGSDGICTSSGSSTPSSENLSASMNAIASSGLTGYFTNNTVVHPSAQPQQQNASAPPYSLGPTFDSTFRDFPNQNRLQSKQDEIRDFSKSRPNVPNTTSFHPLQAQQITGQWRPVPDGLQQSVSNCLPTPFPPPQTVPSSISPSVYSSLYSGSGPFPMQTYNPSHPSQTPQSNFSAPLVVGAENNIPGVSQGSSLQLNNSFQQEYTHNQTVGPNSTFPNQPYTEHHCAQPVLLGCNHDKLTAPLKNSESYLHDESEASSCHLPSDSGTISMFFKGDEAENVEILSPEHQAGHRHSDTDSGFQQSPGQPYISPLYSQPYAAVVSSQAPVSIGSNGETAQMGIEQYFSLSASNQDDSQNRRQPEVPEIGDPHSASGSQYDNVENLECIQNQEVLPSEPSDGNSLSPAANSDMFRYGPLPGPSVSNNSIDGHGEVGPNLETPDSVSHPVRSDSVSSGYSNVSHRSASSATRPQELTGTFIQQESGKPDESPASFFKQIDSSPMDADSSGQNIARNNMHTTLSQAPTPSPPKPTGIFQTSANSSFEPVRSNSIGVKPAEVDQAKMVGEVLENHAIQIKTKTPTMPATSPGNLEQPPDNLETIFIPQTQPFTHVGDPLNLLQPLRGPSMESASLLLDKRPSSRAHGTSKKCESPATTLWAQSELPIFGANVLLAPAAPPVHVPPKPQAKEVIQPPEVGVLDLKSTNTRRVPEQASPQGNISSENLENPPKIGDDEAIHSQASSGYASLLSSPPTESLHNQPLLIAQPNQSLNFTQPIHFSMSSPNQLNQHESNRPPKVEEKTFSANHMPDGVVPGEGALSLLQGGTLSNQYVTTNLPTSNIFPSTSLSQLTSKITSDVLITPPSQQGPLNLATSVQHKIKEEHVLPGTSTNTPVPSSLGTGTNLLAGSGTLKAAASVHHTELHYNNSANRSNNREESSGALDFTISRVASNHATNHFMQDQSRSVSSGAVFNPQPSHVGEEMNDKQSFYRQVTNDKQLQSRLSSEIKDAFCSAPQPLTDLQLPKPSLVEQPSALGSQAPSESKSAQHAAQKEMQTPNNKPTAVVVPPGSASEPPAVYCSAGPVHDASRYQSSSAPAASVGTMDSAAMQEQQRPPTSQTPQQGFGQPVEPSAYMYYRQPYDAYQSAYQTAYSAADPRVAYPVPDPRAAQLYYQNPYGSYDPRYGVYDVTNGAYVDPGRYRYVEPERPSSRCSRTSDRPSSRQGYGEDYGNQKAGWSASNEYYGYYPSHYDYGDPSRWDPYHPAYDPRSRDPRRYWYEPDQDPYRRSEAYPYANRHAGSEDPWQYDPRFDRSFDNEPEPSRGPYADDFDRRSVHSEHSVHSIHSSRSVHSRRSSFSSQSQHSQVYRSQPDLTANVYDASAPPGSLHSDYPYGMYSGNIHTPADATDYSYGYPTEAGWQPAEQVPSRPLTPEKFTVPHVCARFGPGGHFLKVLPNLPSEGQPALVEVHSMETILQHTPEQEEMRAFPGPLLKEETHKVDVINFAQNKATECFQNENLLDKESASLLWDFIVLLCRQNGTVVGTDIAELLLQDHKTVWLPGKSPNEANLIDFSNEPLEQAEETGASQLSFLTDVMNSTTSSIEKETERFRELLLYGRKKDALESAMKHGLWGHALLLASKMDSRTHARVMTRFANSLPINDPLQTVYQLMSGRMPAASTCCGDEKWGDWRPHLAMVLSNLTNNLDVETRTITTMGDTLASRGLLDASHFCYLMAQVGFGVYTKKTTKLVLIGSNHSLPFLRFSSNEAIHRTEAYEYAQSLGTQPCSLPNFQVFKFIYACRLAEVGLAAQAFHYCEVISRTILKHPSYYSTVLIGQLIEISSQLRFFDPQLKEKPEQELFIEPVWLVRLRHLDGQIKQGTMVYNSDRATPQQYACSNSSSELDQVSPSDSTGAAQEMVPGAENPLLATLIPNMMPSVQEVQLVLPDSQAILERPQPLAHQPPASGEPSYPTASPTFLPGTGFGPPQSIQPFVHTYGTDQIQTYTGPSGEQSFPSSPGGESMTEMQWTQDPGLRRFSQDSPSKKTFFDPGIDYSGSVGKVGPRSRNASQSSTRMTYGGRSRTTSESSNHSMGSGRRNSAAKQPSPPPIQEVDGSQRQGTVKESKAGSSSQRSGRSWFPLKIGWLMGKGKNEAHLPDDTNRSIVWDEKKQRWVNMDEPEEESKPPPPPPPGIPKGSQSAPSGLGGPPNSSVNMFSIRAAGARGRYVDVLNPSGTRSGSSIPPPADLFAPLAPMSIPTNLFVPNAVPEDQQPTEGSGVEQATTTDQTTTEHATEKKHSAQIPSAYELPANVDGSQSGELSRSSSMSSLSREVSQHLNQSSNNPAPLGAPPTGAVQFYNPSQFAQASSAAGGSRLGPFGQRKYPTLK